MDTSGVFEMATKPRKPRINITVDNDLNDLLTELAELQGIPKATLISEYLYFLKPHLNTLVDTLKFIKGKKQSDISPFLEQFISEGHAVLDGLKKDMCDD